MACPALPRSTRNLSSLPPLISDPNPHVVQDGAHLRTTSGDYELLFWGAKTGHQITSASEMRDVKWATTTCPLGWSVQGIFPPGADGTDVNSVDRSPDGALLVTGDDFRRVKLFRHPCPKEKAKFKEYKGHAEHVMKVRPF